MFLNLFRRNVNCGTLFCSGGRNLPLVGNLAVTLTISKTYLCKAVSTSSNKTDTMDPGLVRSGTSCGTNKVFQFHNICFDCGIKISGSTLL